MRCKLWTLVAILEHGTHSGLVAAPQRALAKQRRRAIHVVVVVVVVVEVAVVVVGVA